MKIVHYFSKRTDLDWYILEYSECSLLLTMEQVCILLSQGIKVTDIFI